GSQAEVALRREVKQGDPLSPIIFNAIMDPLLEQLERIKGYEIDENHNISALAFADDLILLATAKEDAQTLLQHTESFLCQLGMRIAAEKCATFHIKRTKDSWYVANPDLQLTTGDRIPSSSADSSLNYLGGNISPWYGLQYKDLTDQLKSTLERCRMAHLKPHQKLFLTNSHIIPHFLHKTVLATPSITTIPAMEQAVRNHIKGILHLPMSTPNGLLYCIKRDGGLGIRKLEVLASTTALKQGITLLNTHEPTIHALLHKTKLEQRLQSIAKAIRLQWPIQNYRAIDAYKRSQKKDELKSWGQLQSKVVPQTNVKCRKCKVCNETLAHILGQCVYTKTQRIKRHDEIRDFVSKRVANMSEKAQIIEEASIPTPTGSNLKPDLVVVSREKGPRGRRNSPP
ncbi:hypothetical protein Cfor_02745, partial [Coptotermes formosanus]